MEIGRKFPQFEAEKALFIVCGNHVAKFYAAHKNKLDARGSLKIDNPIYEDREGYFERKGGGRFLGSGSVYENKIDYVEHKFLSMLEKQVRDLSREEDFGRVFLFAPEFIARRIQESLPSEVRKKIGFIAHGNFTRSHPTVLLRMIEERDSDQKREKVPSRREAFAVMENSRRAQKVVGKKMY